VVKLATGNIERRLVIEAVVEELYDVAVLPGIIRPMAIGFHSDEIRFLVRPAPPECKRMLGHAISSRGDSPNMLRSRFRKRVPLERGFHPRAGAWPWLLT
jgi:hypothetical protein